MCAGTRAQGADRLAGSDAKRSLADVVQSSPPAMVIIAGVENDDKSMLISRKTKN